MVFSQIYVGRRSSHQVKEDIENLQELLLKIDLGTNLLYQQIPCRNSINY